MSIKNQSIIEVPTLIDALDYISQREVNEQDFDVMRMRSPGYESEGKFVLFQDNNGEGHLYPVNLSHYMYYRGERKLYPNCYASIYRGLTKEEIFIERLRYCEFALLIEDYPLSNMFHDSFQFPSYQGYVHIPLYIDSLALAQHYGIRTDVIDVTCDKWVAAFFACTFQDKQGKFQYVTDEDQYGMLNIYYGSGFSFPFDDPELRPIGLQPFSRPGEQAGYVVKMKEGEDFYDKCALRIKFRQNARVSELVFNYSNRADKLFPKSILEQKVEMIKSSNTFSKAAFDKCKALYYNNVEERVLNDYIKDRIIISSQKTVCFTEDEKEEFKRKWPEKAQKMASLLILPNFPPAVKLKL